jgi:hypothetical protein
MAQEATVAAAMVAVAMVAVPGSVDVQAAAAKGSESAATVACAAGGRPERTGLQGILQLLQPPSWADEVAAPPTTGLTARGGGAWATLPGGAAAWRVGVQAAEAGPR